MGNIIDELLKKKEKQLKEERKKRYTKHLESKKNHQTEPNYIYSKVPRYLIKELNEESKEKKITRSKYIEDLILNRNVVDKETLLALNKTQLTRDKNENEYTAINIYLPSDVRNEINQELEEINDERSHQEIRKMAKSKYMIYILLNRKKILSKIKR